VETACAHCRTRHILVLDPDELPHIAPLDEVGPVRRTLGFPARLAVAACLGLAAAVAFELARAAGAPAAAAWSLVAAFGVAAAGVLAFRGPAGIEGFLARDLGLEVQRPADGTKVLIPWEKIRAAQYRLFLGNRMALWLAVEGSDGSVPAAPLLAETGVALNTRFRAMPQFLLAMAGRLGDRARFLLPILALPGQPPGGETALALRSETVPGLLAGTLRGEPLARALAEPGDG